MSVARVIFGILATLFVASSTARAAVRSVQVANLTSPVFLTHAGDRRLFVVELGGRIRIVDPARGGVLPVPFLDIDDKVSSGGERGLFSMAFHPDRNGFFYVYYTDNTGAVAIERYRVSANPDVADPSSGQRMLTVPHPFDNHNGGQLQIGPGDGHLYVGAGRRWRAGRRDLPGPDPGQPAGQDVAAGCPPEPEPGAVLRHPRRQSVHRRGRSRQPGARRDLGAGPAQPLAVLVRPGHPRPVHCRRGAGPDRGDRRAAGVGPGRGQPRLEGDGGDPLLQQQRLPGGHARCNAAGLDPAGGTSSATTAATAR